MINCKNVQKSFSGKKVLSGINFDIEDGEIFGLLGPSGAGKTTLIKILTGQLGFDAGTVNVMNKPVASLTGSDKKNIGIMMDRFGVYERLSCFDNLMIFADIYGIPHFKINEVLTGVGLENDAKTPASKLSKGMRARLSLARVFMHSPELIFLDEPTSGLDPQTMKQIHKLILENMELEHNREAAGEIECLLSEGLLETIHSSEPTLETVFLELTGRKLEEE